MRPRCCASYAVSWKPLAILCTHSHLGFRAEERGEILGTRGGDFGADFQGHRVVGRHTLALASRIPAIRHARYFDSITIDGGSKCGRTAYVNKMSTNLAGDFFCAECYEAWKRKSETSHTRQPDA